MKFAPEYVTCVLNENFEDAKAQFLEPADAHPLRAPGDAHRAGDRPAWPTRAPIRAALDGIDLDEVRRVAYDGTYEDLFFYVERLIVEAAARTSPGGSTPRAPATTST